MDYFVWCKNGMMNSCHGAPFKPGKKLLERRWVDLDDHNAEIGKLRTELAKIKEENDGLHIEMERVLELLGETETQLSKIMTLNQVLEAHLELVRKSEKDLIRAIRAWCKQKHGYRVTKAAQKDWVCSVCCVPNYAVLSA